MEVVGGITLVVSTKENVSVFSVSVSSAVGVSTNVSELVIDKDEVTLNVPEMVSVSENSNVAEMEYVG